MPPDPVILAVASPPRRSMRGIVRISGAATFELLGPHVRGVGSWERGAYRARLSIDSLALPALALVFVGPRSYTGEDGVEIQLPGNPVLLERVIDGLVGSGAKRGLVARRAEAGEFSARAFFNGRVTLLEAEGVAATIAARSDAELRAAALLTGGALGDLARRLADELAEGLALVEAGIDFTDQDGVVAIEPGSLAGRLDELRRTLAAHLDRAVGTEQLAAIPWVVLAGPANAGKSTLFNALLGQPRAVVDAAAGTTRDALAEPLGLEGCGEVILVDVAGADDAPDPMNRRMQRAARGAIERAELVVRCAPADAPPPPPAGGELLARTKCDLGAPPGPGLAVSAVTGAGVEALRAAIAERLESQAVSLASDALALAPRHEALLRSAARHLAEARAELAAHRLDRCELVAAAMRLSLDDLGRLAGTRTPDDVLGRVFAAFCVGK